MKPYLLLIITFAGVQGVAQDSKSLRATKIDKSEIVLDGQLSEPFWESVQSIDDFRMQEPIEGGEPTERTVIKIAIDEDNLYIGAIFYDSDPSGIKSFQKKRDAPLRTDDRFMWIMDTFLDGRNAYFFEINPGGLLGDGVLTTGQGTSLNKDWDGIWRPWTYIGDFGWSTEIRIPFRTLNFDPDSDTWGINFKRTIRRKSEELIWSGHLRNQGLTRPQNAGKLTGLNNLSQGMGLEVVPYVKLESVRVESETGSGFDKETNPQGGFDINYNITPSLKASFTMNTDFAETEVDTRRVNLTRFPLRFQEKRDFFLEGSNTFSFAPRSGVNPYFSRRIGLDAGNPIPIAYGGRLLGRAGKLEIGAQHVRTKEVDSLSAEDFSVVRLKRNFLKESGFGIVYTRRSTASDEFLTESVQDRHTFGTDLSLNTSTFLNDKNLQFQAFYVMHNPYSPGDDSTTVADRSSRGFRFNFPNKPWSAAWSYREFGDQFDPAIGFNQRNGFRRTEPQVSYSPLIERSDIIRELTWNIKFEHLMGMDWKKLTQNIRIIPLSIRFETGDRLQFQFSRTYDQLDENFDILRDSSIVVPQGDYLVWNQKIELRTANQRRVVFGAEVEFGGFWSGTKTTYDANLTLRPIPGINLTTTYIFTDVALAEGAFQTNLIRFTGNIDLTPFISFTTNIQYDDVSERLGMNNRFRYTITPGSDVFLVYNHNWIDDVDGLRTTSNSGIVKASYTHRF